MARHGAGGDRAGKGGAIASGDVIFMFQKGGEIIIFTPFNIICIFFFVRLFHLTK